MDVIRAVLGEKRISYFGVSYGTYLGAVYAQLFANRSDRSDRIVLDSAVDAVNPGRFGRGTYLVMAEGSEVAFRDWRCPGRPPRPYVPPR